MNRVKLCISVEETQFDMREHTFPDWFLMYYTIQNATIGQKRCGADPEVANGSY